MEDSRKSPAYTLLASGLVGMSGRDLFTYDTWAMGMGMRMVDGAGDGSFNYFQLIGIVPIYLFVYFSIDEHARRDSHTQLTRSNLTLADCP